MEKINKACMCYTAKVIPLAFDESMSYYEQLCKLTAKMNELINFANNELTEQLKEYINQEFNNMMVDSMYDATTETLVLYLRKESDE